MIQPTTVYLDTAIWNRLADGLEDAPTFEHLVQGAAIQPILSFTHMVDIAVQGDELRGRRTAYIDRIATLAPLRWVRELEALADLELQAAFHRHVGLGEFQTPDPFVPSVLDTFRDRRPIDDERAARGLPFSEHVKLLVGSKAWTSYLKGRQELPRDMAGVRANRSSRKRLHREEQLRWVRDRVARRVITPAGVIVPIGQDTIESFVAGFDFSRTPCLQLRIAFVQGSILSPGADAPSNAEDLYHIAAIPHCDVTFADKRTVELLRVAQVPIPNSLVKNGGFPSWLRVRASDAQSH